MEIDLCDWILLIIWLNNLFFINDIEIWKGNFNQKGLYLSCFFIIIEYCVAFCIDER